MEIPIFHWPKKETDESIAIHEKRIASTAIGILFVLLIACFLFFSNSGFFFSWMNVIEDKIYDLQVRHTFKPLGAHSETVIVAIDDKSIEAEGRLPWSRKKMAELIERLQNYGAKWVALDFMFPQPENNLAEEVIQDLRVKKQVVPPELQNIQSDFDYDRMFADRLASQPAVLGMYFGGGDRSIGVLPEPLIVVKGETSHAYLPHKTSYLGNIAILQKAAKYGGFINSTPDEDGIIRFAPLIYQYRSDLYGSLGLIAARQFLNVQSIQLFFKPYEDINVLESIALDQTVIPVDLYGRLLIPFRGASPPFLQISASDVLRGQAPPEALHGKLVFVGATATGSGDLFPVAVSPLYPSIVVHASIAQGIIENYLPFRPTWGKGLSVALILGLGLPFAFFLPRIGPVSKLLLCVWGIASLIYLSHWLWVEQKMVISVFFPVLVLATLLLFDTIYGYVMKSRQTRAIKQIFGQYVSSEYIDLMMHKKKEFGLYGEVKELAILISDIRNFTPIAEKMSAPQLQRFLNNYLSEMTQLIFDTRGTIDKYIGDAIMAFWGAPLDDPEKSRHAVFTALAMNKKLKEDSLAVPIHIGIGITMGAVYVGDMGSKFHRSYTAIGDHVNLASRLSDLAKYYFVEVIVAGSAEADTREVVFYRRLDRVCVKGKKLVVPIFEPICQIEEVTPAIKEEVECHHAALDAYSKGDFKEARVVWENLFKEKGNKNLYAMYLERCKGSPPSDPNWDGVQIFEMK